MSGPVELFGAVRYTSAWSSNTDYVAGTDGFVVAGGAGTGAGEYRVVVRNSEGAGWTCRVTGNNFATSVCAVKRGWTYRVSGSGAGFWNWVPFGND